MTNKLFHIIINPVGASGATNKLFRKVEPYLQKENIHYVVHTSSKEESISEIVAKLTSTNEDTFLVVIGGDGSLNEAVNGIVSFEHTYFGFIPCGSGNDYARSLSLTNNLYDLIQQIFKGEVHRTCDVGEITLHNYSDAFRNMPSLKENKLVRRFNVSAGIGFDAEICQKVHVSKVKPFLNKIHLGKLAYIIEAIRVIFSTKMVPVKITLDNQTKAYDKCLFAAVMNEPYEGGGFKFCPKASGEDHVLDICYADHLSKFDFFRIFPYAYSGSHVKFKGVYTSQFTNVDIQTEVPLWVHTDGEVYCKSTHISAKLLDEKLKLIE